MRSLRVGFEEEAPKGRETGDPSGFAEVVRGVSFGLWPGEILALVGESGSGKTLTALAILGLLPPGGRILGGSLRLRDAGDLARLGRRERRRLRGRRIAMIFQDPMSALNPVLTVGFQIAEVLRAHRGMNRRRALAEARSLLELVAMPDPERRLRSYPHQLSGGQLQRAMIAMALACQPDVLLADEPTTALDVTLQAQILDLLEDLRRRLGVAILLITHDLAVVAEIADRVAVMYAGHLVEEAAVSDLYAHPAHPYSRHLLAAASPRAAGVGGGGGPDSEGPGLDLGTWPAGCAYHPRCPEVMPRCRREVPDRIPVDAGGTHAARCFLYAEAEGTDPS